MAKQSKVLFGSKAKDDKQPTVDETVVLIASDDIDDASGKRLYSEGDAVKGIVNWARYYRAVTAALHSGDTNTMRRIDRMSDADIYNRTKDISVDASDERTQEQETDLARVTALTGVVHGEDMIEPLPVIPGKAPLEAAPPLRAMAIEAGKRLSKETLELIGDKFPDAKETWDGAAMVVAARLLKEEGRDVIDQWPMPNTTKDNVPEGYNGFLDKYPIKGEDKPGHFYGEMWSNPDNPKAERQNIAIRQLKRIADNIEPEAGTPPEWRNLTQTEAKVHLGRWRSRKNNSVNKLGQTAKFLKVAFAFEDKLPRLKWRLFNAAEGEYGFDTFANEQKLKEAAQNKTPIIVCSALDSGKAQNPMAVSTFCNLKIAETVEAGGTFADFKELHKRKSRGEGNKGGDTAPGNNNPEINRVAEFTDRLMPIGNYLDKDKAFDTILREINRPNGAKDGNRELILLIYKIGQHLDPLYEAVKVRGQRYAAEENNQNEAQATKGKAGDQQAA